MKNESDHNFDLTSLLRLNDLNVQMASRNNLSLQTGEYFRLLSKFIHNAPQIKECLGRISSLEGDENDILLLEENKTLMEDIGCEKFSPLVNDIIRAGKEVMINLQLNRQKKY
jgi:hypothetical protein